MRGKIKIKLCRKCYQKEKLERQKWKLYSINNYCSERTAMRSICLRRKKIGVNSRICWHLIWNRWTRQRGNFRPLCILNFIQSGANQKENNTGLAPSRTSIHLTSHLTWKSSVFIMVKHTWRQTTSDDVNISGVDSIVLFGDVFVHIR